MQKTLKSVQAVLARQAASRLTWTVLAALSCALVAVGHDVFQVWLYMKPCEQCVYIRFAFVVLALGAAVVALCPRCAVLQCAGAATAVYGAGYGWLCSFHLQAVHQAVRSDDLAALFGIQGCSLEPHFPLALPLHQWFPDWFLPTGQCGYEISDVPAGAVLSAGQSALISLYNASDGWYLIPQWQFLTMAQCCLIGFTVALTVVLLLWGSWMREWLRAR